MVLLLLQTGLGLLYQQASQFVDKWHEQQSQGAEQEHEQHLTLSLKDYKQDICGINEISVFGELYDVASAAVCGENVDLIAINYVCEEDIVDEYVKTLRRTGSQGQKYQQSMQEFLTFYCIHPALFLIIAGFLPSSIGQGKYLIFLVGESPDIPSPPPQLV